MKYQNNQLYSECQLVALWNAARFYNIDVPIMGTQEYYEICKESKCLYGSCLNILNEEKRLGLKLEIGKYNLNWVKNNLPVKFDIFCHRGYHSVLGIKTYRNKILLANYARDRTHWINWKQLKEKCNKKIVPISYVKRPI